MPLPRRKFIQQGTLAAAASLAASQLLSRLAAATTANVPASAATAATAIDRQAVVGRHAIRVASLDPSSPLTVGDGDFAFTVDATGLQSFENLYHDKGIPLETRSTWAWHSFPNTENLKYEDATTPFDFHGRPINFANKESSPAAKYFRENPHPVPLGQISLIYKGEPLKPEDIAAIDQTLDLWTGIVRSNYTLAGQPVAVETTAQPGQSRVAVRVRSPLVQNGDLQVRFRFPYSYLVSGKNNPPLVWDQDAKHHTDRVNIDTTFAHLQRILDDSKYFTTVNWEGAGVFTKAADHDFRLKVAGTDTLTFVCTFSAEDIPWAQYQFLAKTSFEDVRAASIAGWKDYWTKGGIVDLADATDPRAKEIERRIIISMYLMKVNFAGKFPPAETGLTCLSWYGKHNSEMYFWHAAQFHIWGRTDLLEKSLAWYQRILPLGQADAKSQGFDGVRWPKMAGIDGKPGPGGINPFIIWNQPNPIYLCELVYRAHPTRETLEKYRDIVFESAKFLASFAWYDTATGRYVLGPPVKNVSESTDATKVMNPTFELAFWHYGLQVAQTWRERLGLAPESKWADVLAKLARLTISDGKYVEMETNPGIYQSSRGNLPSSELLAYGYLPATAKVDLAVFRATFDEVNTRNRVANWSSWAAGTAAMAAARLGETETAASILTNQNFTNNGHVAHKDLPVYLPINSAYLAAAGLMAGSWDGAPPVNAPGFPQNGQWAVKVEGLNPLP